MKLPNATAVPGEAEIVSRIRELFQNYGPTFVELATGKRSDVEALLAFYGAPLRFIGSTFHMVMESDAAITGADGMGGELARLRQAGFSGSSLDRCEICVLNPRAALVDAVWIRRDGTGAVMSRFAVIYLVTLAAGGWRITSAVNTSE
ncbi:hypothetical protein [Dyella humicola]|uniref:DUF6841 family protein n=1 Tax=Dyella humicola TaxID=2992126 RepID=UPI0022533BC1|nr:hypothetical protein [Dyella humicola]